MLTWQCTVFVQALNAKAKATKSSRSTSGYHQLMHLPTACLCGLRMPCLLSVLCRAQRALLPYVQLCGSLPV